MEVWKSDKWQHLINVASALSCFGQWKLQEVNGDCGVIVVLTRGEQPKKKRSDNTLHPQPEVIYYQVAHKCLNQLEAGRPSGELPVLRLALYR